MDKGMDKDSQSGMLCFTFTDDGPLGLHLAAGSQKHGCRITGLVEDSQASSLNIPVNSYITSANGIDLGSRNQSFDQRVKSLTGITARPLILHVWVPPKKSVEVESPTSPRTPFALLSPRSSRRVTSGIHQSL